MNRYYEILGLAPGASPADVKQAYRALAKTWHPDQFAGNPALQRQAEEKLKAINEAYHHLKDYQPRSSSNQSTRTSRPPSGHASPRPTVSTKSTNAEFWYHRGAENASAGRYKEALEDLSMAIRLNPRYVEAFRYRGFVHSMLGFELGAESDLQQAKTLELEQRLTGDRATTQTPTPQHVHRQQPAQPTNPTPPRASSWACIQTLPGHTDSVTGIVVSRDNKFLVSGSRDATVRFWNLKTATVFHTLAKHQAPITAIALSLDGQLLATSGDDYTIKLWDLQLGNHLRSWTGHTGAINALAFSPDKYILISGSHDGTTRFWHLRAPHSKPVIQHHNSPVRAIAISRDGHLAMSGGDDRILTLYQTRTGEVLRSLIGHPAAINSLAVSPNGKLFATGGSDGTIAIWADSAVVSGNLERIWVAHVGAVRSLVFSPDGRLLASGGADGKTFLWNPLNGDRLAALVGHSDSIQALAFSSTGRTLFSGSADGAIALWQPT
jgi:curved DNA-binding protein CbpA